MKIKYFIIAIATSLLSINGFSQTIPLLETDRTAIVEQIKKEILDSLNHYKEMKENKPPKDFTISSYLEAYYSYDFGNPEAHNKPNFIYSHNRHNEININLGFIKAAYLTETVRSNLSLAVGTYMNANYSAEPTIMKNIYEANVGVKISNKRELWVDAGIMPSHIGFESALGKDNGTVTRGLYAENSPYFNAGVKITYITDNGKWLVGGVIMNGWQKIYRADGNNTSAFGHQLTYKPNGNIILNSSSFIGNDKSDSTKQMRYFHNFYAQIQLHKKFLLIAGFDIGAQQKSKRSSTYNTWYSPAIIAKYSPTEKINIAARGEYYNDVKGVIISTGTINGFQTFGYSINLDYNIADNVVWRIEGRGFSSKDKIFILDKQPYTKNYFLTTSLAISF